MGGGDHSGSREGISGQVKPFVTREMEKQCRQDDEKWYRGDRKDSGQ